jgi:hypothetical protein
MIGRQNTIFFWINRVSAQISLKIMFILLFFVELEGNYRSNF